MHWLTRSSALGSDMPQPHMARQGKVKGGHGLPFDSHSVKMYPCNE